MNSRSFLIKVFILLTDFVLIDLAWKLSHYITVNRAFTYQEPDLSFFFIFNLSWTCISLFFRIYERDQILDFKLYFQNLIISILVHLGFILLYTEVFSKEFVTKTYLAYTYLIGFFGMTAFRFIATRLYNYYTRLSYRIRRIVVVGRSNSADELYDFFNSQEAKVFRYMGFKEDWLNDENKIDLDSIRPKLEELKRFCTLKNIKELYLTLPLTCQELIEDLALFADDNFIHFRMVPNFGVLEQKALTVDFFGHVPILSLRAEPLKLLINRLVKRAFDIFFSLMVLLLIFPILFPIIALLIKVESRGPIFFKQKRSGRENKEFDVYKFRTMTVNRDSDAKQATKGDKRITKIGGILRKTSLDEFPQFINVLLGHMSVVGPRPHMLKHTEEYSQIIDRFLYRHFILPGITGYAQINGFRGGTETPGSMKKRIEYDNWYIENWSLMLDIKIIFLTVWNIIAGEENAY